MKRDIRLIHKILQLVEQHGTGLPYKPQVEGRSAEEVDYHVSLCVEANFLHPARHDNAVTNLTWAGHNALDKLNAGCEMSDIADCSV